MSGQPGCSVLGEARFGLPKPELDWLQGLTEAAAPTEGTVDAWIDDVTVDVWPANEPRLRQWLVENPAPEAFAVSWQSDFIDPTTQHVLVRIDRLALPTEHWRPLGHH